MPVREKDLHTEQDFHRAFRMLLAEIQDALSGDILPENQFDFMQKISVEQRNEIRRKLNELHLYYAQAFKEQRYMKSSNGYKDWAKEIEQVLVSYLTVSFIGIEFGEQPC